MQKKLDKSYNDYLEKLKKKLEVISKSKKLKDENLKKELNKIKQDKNVLKLNEIIRKINKENDKNKNIEVLSLIPKKINKDVKKVKIFKKLTTQKLNWYSRWVLYLSSKNVSNLIVKNFYKALLNKESEKNINSIFQINYFNWKLDVDKIYKVIWKHWYLILYVYMWKSWELKINSSEWEKIISTHPWVYKIIFNFDKNNKKQLKIKDLSNWWLFSYLEITWLDIESYAQIYKIKAKLSTKNLKQKYTDLKDAINQLWLANKDFLNWQYFNLTWNYVFSISNGELKVTDIQIKWKKAKEVVKLDLNIYLSPYLNKYLKNWLDINDVNILSAFFNFKQSVESVSQTNLLDNDNYLKYFSFDDWTNFNDNSKIWKLTINRKLSWALWLSNDVSWQLKEDWIIYPGKLWDNNWFKYLRWSTIILWKLVKLNKETGKWKIYIYPLFDKDWWVIIWKLWSINSFFKYTANSCWSVTSPASKTVKVNWKKYQLINWKKYTSNYISNVIKWLKEEFKNWKLTEEEFKCIKKNISTPSMIFYWDTRKWLQEIVSYMFTVDPTASNIEDSIKYKYITSIPMYWQQLVKIQNWNDAYIIKFINSKEELENLKSKWLWNYIYQNIWAFKLTDVNWDWEIDSKDIKKLNEEWIFDVKENKTIELSSKASSILWKNLLKTNEIKEMLKQVWIQK